MASSGSSYEIPSWWVISLPLIVTNFNDFRQCSLVKIGLVSHRQACILTCLRRRNSFRSWWWTIRDATSSAAIVNLMTSVSTIRDEIQEAKHQINLHVHSLQWQNGCFSYEMFFELKNEVSLNQPKPELLSRARRPRPPQASEPRFSGRPREHPRHLHRLRAAGRTQAHSFAHGQVRIHITDTYAQRDK